MLPWWKILLYILGTALAVITIRISIKFDLNTWLQSRRTDKEIKERVKRSEECPHLWTLYRLSPYSSCNMCLSWIATSTLLAASQLAGYKHVIAGESSNLLVHPEPNAVIVSNPIGARK